MKNSAWVVVALIVMLFATSLTYAWSKEYYERKAMVDSIEIGMTKREVVDRCGYPNFNDSYQKQDIFPHAIVVTVIEVWTYYLDDFSMAEVKFRSRGKPAKVISVDFYRR